MEYQVQIQQVEPQTTAVIRCRAKLNELTTVVPHLCGEVWTFLRTAQVPRPGRLLALYLDGEINLEVGVELPHPFAASEHVICSGTPGGLVATAVHLGPYQLLGQAHQAIVRWCAEHGYTLAGPNWEIYGHWCEDPAQLRTDVYYLLQPAPLSE